MQEHRTIGGTRVIRVIRNVAAIDERAAPLEIVPLEIVPLEIVPRAAPSVHG
jgi:hypothetical protein